MGGRTGQEGGRARGREDGWKGGRDGGTRCGIGRTGGREDGGTGGEVLQVGDMWDGRTRGASSLHF